MSGPKAFRIVTREQVVAICEGHLARLDLAIAEWTHQSERNAGATADEIAAVAKRRDSIARLMAEDRFTDLQKQVPAEISFLQGDIQRRLEKATRAAAEARQAARRAARTAQMLLDALDKAGRPVPQALRRDLMSSAPATTAAAISRAFALLSVAPEPQELTGRQRALVTQLGQGEARTTLADWLAIQPAAPEESALLPVDRHLAELSALGAAIDAFEQRASAVAAEASPARRALLADSLTADLAAALKSRRERNVTLASLNEHRFELARLTQAVAPALVARIDAALAQPDGTDLAALIQEANTAIGEGMRLAAADARRRAVLQGLASLGYEVTEGMATAWVQNGNVVLRKSSVPGYGVELGGGVRSDQLQVRAVVLGSSHTVRDPQRDRDMETIWCGEFDRLQQLIAARGGGIEIERALPVGAVPLKMIDDGSQAGTIEDEVPGTRSLSS